MEKRNNETANISSTNTAPKGRRRRQRLAESEVLRRKSRMIGSDDISLAANMCRWGSEAGLRGTDLAAAEGLAKAFDAMLALSQKNSHYEAAKKAKSCEYVLKRNERVGNMKLTCRDGKQRKLSQVVSWFASRHFRIASDIEEALQAEAAVAEKRRLEAEAKANKAIAHSNVG